MTAETAKQIEATLDDCVSRAIKRTRKSVTHRPFHDALLTKELVLGSAFERSFSTSFGQGPIEQISELLAKDNGYTCERQKEIWIDITKGANDEIGRIMESLRNGSTVPNWKNEVKRVNALAKGDRITVRIVTDLWIQKGQTERFISIKTVKPNIDQVEKAKKDMLLLKAHKSSFETYLGLYYNPGGPRREDYNWTVPSKIFNLMHDECILIGKDYWELIGGEGTYDSLLQVFATVGKATKERLQKLIE